MLLCVLEPKFQLVEPERENRTQSSQIPIERFLDLARIFQMNVVDNIRVSRQYKRDFSQSVELVWSRWLGRNDELDPVCNLRQHVALYVFEQQLVLLGCCFLALSFGFSTGEYKAIGRIVEGWELQMIINCESKLCGEIEKRVGGFWRAGGRHGWIGAGRHS